MVPAGGIGILSPTDSAQVIDSIKREKRQKQRIRLRKIQAGSRIDVDGTEYEHFIWRARFDYFGDGLSVSDFSDLIFVQPDIVAKEFQRLGVLGVGDRVDKQKKNRGEEHLSESYFDQHCLAIPFRPFLEYQDFLTFISCPARAMRTIPGDKQWKQRATAVRRRLNVEAQNLCCSKERRLREREPLQRR